MGDRMADASTDIFRAAALERLSSPDQLDQLSALPSPLERAALFALAGVVLAAITWSVLGSIPTFVV